MRILLLIVLLGGCTAKGGDSSLGESDPHDSPSGDSPSTYAPFALLSLNLHCLSVDGTTYANNTERFGAIAALIAAEDVAVVALQELCDDGAEDALPLIEGAVEAATGEAWSSTSALAHIGWEGTEDEAEESVGLLVRGALSDAGSLTYVVQGGLNRVASWATLPESLGGLVVWSVHLEVLSGDARTAQARETAGATLTLADPSLNVLVAGDFNDVEGSGPHAALVAAGFTDLSDGLGAERIDHVFAHRGAVVQVSSSKLVFDGVNGAPVSDHPGVLVHLSPADGAAVALTRFTAMADPGWGHYLTIRGDTAPLSWDWGWPLQSLGTGTWGLTLSELPDGATIAYKTLIDDTTWQTGDNSVGVGGAENVVSPAY